jgi:type II secretory pathway component GspD/PulD (secretin)
MVSGQEQEIFAGDNVPIRTEQSQAGDPLQVRQNIERQDTGVTLRVTPTIGEEGDIHLDLTVEVSAVVPTAQTTRRLDLGNSNETDTDGYGGITLPGSGSTTTGTGDPTVVGPTIQKRTLSTKIHIEHDRVAVIGYEAGPMVLDLTTGAPWLKDIPVLGAFFKSTTHRTVDSHLIITVAAWRDDSDIRALRDAMERALAPAMVDRMPSTL